MIKSSLRIAALLAGAAAFVIPAAPAHAAGSDCSGGNVCMWEDSNYSNDKYVDYTDGSLSGNRMDIDGFNGDNEISSIKNETDKWVVVWENDDYTNRLFCLSPGQDTANITNDFSWGANDDAESFSLYGSKPSGC